MSKFEFRSNLLALEIAGESFEIDPTAAGEIIHARVPEFEKIQAEFKSGMGSEKIEKACQVLTGLFDDVLGQGASSRIFKGRAISLYDCTDLYFYITGEIQLFATEKTKRYAAMSKQHRGNKK